MEYYALLLTATVVIAVLAIELYRVRPDLGLMIGVSALYYWSLYGAWSVVLDKTGGSSGRHYYYLENKMFPVSLDANYLIALSLYSVFIIVVELAVLVTLSRSREHPVPRIVLRHEPILILGALAAVASFAIIRNNLSTAWELNSSAYVYTRQHTNEWFTLHQVLNRVALIPPAIGFATLAAGNRSKYFVNIVRRYTWAGYGVLFTGMAAFTFVIGNKNEVFTALLTGVLTYTASVKKPNWGRLACVGLAGLWFLYSIDFFRGTPISGMQEALTQRLDEATEVGRFVASSNEAFAAHFSMYGVLAAGTEPKFGYSIYSLLCSAVPRVLWPDRPQDIYFYYSESVGAVQNQGYSLHHATGWYLNFGYAGVVIGAAVMGLLWAAALNAHQKIRGESRLLHRLLAIIAPFIFVAGLPALLRAGPEGYKGMLIEGVLIPMTALAFSCRTQRPRRNVLRWDAQRGWVLPKTAHPAALLKSS